MELYRGVHQISSLFSDGRALFQYFLVGARSVLIDSGVDRTPEETILPYLDNLDLDVARLWMMITTHPDLDHQGGNSAMRKAAPAALLACGEADRSLVEDPACLFRDRYNYLHNEHNAGPGNESIPRDAGSRCRVDIGLRGGERLALDVGWELEVLHVPGHSRGHLALYDPSHKTAFVSDAVHGHGCPKVDGSMGLPVTYYHIDLYLSTLAHLETLPLEHLHTGHWPSMHGDEIRDFFSDSRKTVETLDQKILGKLKLTRTGMSLNELMDAAMEEFPDWPANARELTAFPVKGHLDRLESCGQVSLDRSVSPPRWRAV